MNDCSHTSPRAIAYQILKSVLINGESLTKVFSDYQNVPPFAKAICFGSLRDYQRLLIIMNHLVSTKPKKKALEVLLIMGIFQLHSSEKPDYACVSETVSLARENKMSWACGMVNGVLRRFIRDRELIITLCEQDKLYVVNNPPWLVKKLRQAWPNQYEHLLVEINKQAPMSIRINLVKITREAYAKKLAELGVGGVCSKNVSSSITLSTPIEVSQLPGFNQGLVSVQDEAAQFASVLLKLAPGQRILDACSAPGGKTCHIIEFEPELKEVVAIDVSEKRLKTVRDNLDRLSLDARLICTDAAEVSAWWDGEKFDRVLLDVPCSATGVIRRHPDIKYHRKVEDIHNLVLVQKRLLKALWNVLKPGGLLVYATCSILPEENEEQIKNFLYHHRDAKLESIEIYEHSASNIGMQLFPKHNGYDGFYYAVLRKERGKVSSKV